MKIVFMGTMDFAVELLEGLVDHHEVSLVVTQPDRPSGRKQKLKPSPVKKKAMELDLELFQPKNIKKNHNPILEQNADIHIVAGYGQMIPDDVLYAPLHDSVNVHASLLPKYRGGSPMHAAIKNGDEYTGVTTMKMVKRMDAGPIYDQTKVDIAPDDNVGTLERKLSVAGRRLLLNTLRSIEAGTATLRDQDKDQVSFAYHIRPKDRYLDFTQTAEELRDHIRAFNPWPIARFRIDDETCKVFEAEVIKEDKPFGQPGEVVVADKKRLHIQTKKHQLAIESIQYPGKKRMDIDAFMNGIGRSLFYEGKIIK